MEKIIDFVKWFSAQNSRAIAIVFGSSIFIGQTFIIVYLHKTAKENEQIVRDNERKRDSLDTVNYNRYNANIIALQTENKELYNQISDCKEGNIKQIENYAKTFRDLYEKRESLKIENER